MGDLERADDDGMAQPKMDWRLPVEAAKPGAGRPVMWTPGPVDVKAYESGHARGTSYEASHKVTEGKEDEKEG